MTLGGSSPQASEPPGVIESSPSSPGSLTADTGSAGSCPSRLDPFPEVAPSPSDERLVSSMTLGGSSIQAAEPPGVIESSPSSQGSLTADTGSAGSCPPRLDPPAEVVPSPSDGRPGAFDDLRRLIYVRSSNLSAPPPPRRPQKPHRRPEQLSPPPGGETPALLAPERGSPHTFQPHRRHTDAPNNSPRLQAGRHRRPWRRRGALRIPLSHTEATPKPHQSPPLT